MVMNHMNGLKIRAAIFDMDGVLIDSEPLWQEAERRVFGQLGLELTPEMCLETLGMRVDQVVRHRYARQPWNGPALQEVEDAILAEMERLIAERGVAMPGVHRILGLLREHGIRLALASSSYMRIIRAVLGKLELQNAFEVVHSAEFEAQGKPHPAIYLTTLEKLGVPASEAVAFEDSPNGVRAARAAGLKTVCIPYPDLRDDPVFDQADLKLTSLLEFEVTHLQTLAGAHGSTTPDRRTGR